MQDPDYEIALFKRANPYTLQARMQGSADARAERDLEAILSGVRARENPTVPARRRSHYLGRRVLVISACAALVAGMLAVTGVGQRFGLTGQTAYAATPKALSYRTVSGDPRTVLNKLADKVSRLPDDTGSGPYAYHVIKSWDLWTRVDGDINHSKVIPQTKVTLVKADGSGRVEVTKAGDPTKAVTNLRVGGYSFLWPLGSLTSSNVSDALNEGHPQTNGPAERFVAVQDAFSEQVFPPSIRAALIRYIAGTPGLSQAQSVTDRLGRAGLAVSVDSRYSGLPTRYSVIFSDRDGSMLGEEQTLTQTAGSLNVPIPSIISYTIYSESRYTGGLGAS